ncbi:MAG: hypothetical protein WDN06_00960 [Asticcacaulis sp.]
MADPSSMSLTSAMTEAMAAPSFRVQITRLRSGSAAVASVMSRKNSGRKLWGITDELSRAGAGCTSSLTQLRQTGAARPRDAGSGVRSI